MSKEKTFGQRLRELRKAKNLSQRDLADKVAARLKSDDGRGFDFSYLSKIENDKTPPPSVPAIIQLAYILEADADEFITLAGKVPPDLGEALKESKAARMFYRSALNANLSEEEWKELLQALKHRKKGN